MQSLNLQISIQLFMSSCWKTEPVMPWETDCRHMNTMMWGCTCVVLAVIMDTFPEDCLLHSSLVFSCACSHWLVWVVQWIQQRVMCQRLITFKPSPLWFSVASFVHISRPRRATEVRLGGLVLFLSPLSGIPEGRQQRNKHAIETVLSRNTPSFTLSAAAAQKSFPPLEMS